MYIYYSEDSIPAHDFTLHLDSIIQVKTLCERELSAFMLVAPVLLFNNPCIRHRYNTNKLLCLKNTRSSMALEDKATVSGHIFS